MNPQIMEVSKMIIWLAGGIALVGMIPVGLGLLLRSPRRRHSHSKRKRRK